jgi:phosphoglucomutase
MTRNEILARAQEYIAAEKDPFFRAQVETLVRQENLDELNDRFYTNLAFGTGGLRGIIGGGFNRMNPYTVQRATQGLANYVLKSAPQGASAVIAFDSRNFSDTFALEAAKVFCGNGITAYLFPSVSPTPQLSFAIRHLRAITGIVVTASHNPAEYNGYKAYWSDGCQVFSPHDTAIVKEAASVTEIKVMDPREAEAKNLLIMLDAAIDEAYLAMVRSLSIRPELLREKGGSLKAVYTPLHGTGGRLIPAVLEKMGVRCICVEEQMKPDGNFPTVKSPNPEESSALKMAIDRAKLDQADLVLATDPDSDRLGIAVRNKSEFVLVSGNQLGALLAEYIFSSRTEKGTLPAKPAFVKTIVTTELQRKIAEKYHAACFDVLTGFKYIGGLIRDFEAGDSGYEYIFGGEESFGYLIGTAVRDKDAISAATMTAEMALYNKSRGRSLLDQLDALYREFGFYQEVLINKVFRGESGVRIMNEFMESLRTNPPRTFAGQAVTHIKDYRDGTIVELKTGRSHKSIGLPSSNVLQFVLIDDSVVSVRPSGTEPKIKFYASCCENPAIPLDLARENVGKKIEAIRSQVNTLIDG